MGSEGSRLLDIVLDGVDIATGSPTPYPAQIAGSPNWEILDNALAPTFAMRTYYDLSGYQVNDLTALIQGVQIQEGFAPYGNLPFQIVDIISTDYIDNDTLVAAYTYDSLPGDLPGFNDSTYDMMQIIYGSIRTYDTNANLANPLANVGLAGAATWGTGTATAGEKLYITRVVYTSDVGAPSTVANIPPSNYVTGAFIAKEPDLEYIMRLKRSYEYLDNGS